MTPDIDTADFEDAAPPQTHDIRALTAAALAVLSLAGTVAVIIIGLLTKADVTEASLTLGGFTTTFGAYALGIQSETQE